MGWGHSPPYYCAFTEKGADVANASIATPISLQFHHLEANTQTSPFPLDCTYAPTASLPFNLLLPAPPLAYTDVYIDDFLALAHNLMWTLLHSIDSIFRDDPNLPWWQVASASKLEKGGATWSYQKHILGWDISVHPIVPLS